MMTAVAFRTPARARFAAAGLRVFLLAAILAGGGLLADPAPVGRPAIYDTQADGAKLVADAVARAGKENKRVLLMFGANWCGWCHKLHGLFASDPQIAATLKEHYVLVLVDVDKGHNAAINEKYGRPTQLGLPALVVLDAAGGRLTTQDTGILEAGDHHDPAKVLAFLERWAQAKP